MVVQMVALAHRVAVLATLTVIIPQQARELDVLVLHVALRVQHTVKILPITLADARDHRVVLLVVRYARIHLIILQGDAQDLHVQASVKENVLLHVLKHVQATVPESAVMDARAIVVAVARTLVQEAVDDSAAYLVVVLALANALLVAPHSVLTSPRGVAVEAAQEVAV